MDILLEPDQDFPDCLAPEEQIPAPPKKTPVAKRPEDLEAVDDPHRLARLFAREHEHSGQRTLHYWRDEFHRWQGNAYQAIPDNELRALLGVTIKREFDRDAQFRHRKWQENGGRDDSGKPAPEPVAKKVSGKLIADVRQALAGLCLLPGSMDAPAWLTPNVVPATEMLATASGLLNLRT